MMTMLQRIKKLRNLVETVCEMRKSSVPSNWTPDNTNPTFSFDCSSLTSGTFEPKNAKTNQKSYVYGECMQDCDTLRTICRDYYGDVENEEVAPDSELQRTIELEIHAFD